MSNPESRPPQHTEQNMKEYLPQSSKNLEASVISQKELMKKVHGEQGFNKAEEQQYVEGQKKADAREEKAAHEARHLAALKKNVAEGNIKFEQNSFSSEEFAQMKRRNAALDRAKTAGSMDEYQAALSEFLENNPDGATDSEVRAIKRSGTKAMELDKAAGKWDGGLGPDMSPEALALRNRLDQVVGQRRNVEKGRTRS